MKGANPFGDWGLMDRVILRECEIRLRNADVLRGTLSKRLKELAQPSTADWQTVTRPVATMCLVEAQALFDEYYMLIKEVSEIDIPPSEPEAIHRRVFVKHHAEDALGVMKMAVPAIKQMIADEDANDATSSRPSSSE